MSITAGACREYISLFRTCMTQCDNGDVKKQREKMKNIWAVVRPLSLRQSGFSVENQETQDGKLSISTAYLVYFREDPGVFDTLHWNKKFYKKLSGVQKGERDWRCVMGAYKEIVI